MEIKIFIIQLLRGVHIHGFSKMASFASGSEGFAKRMRTGYSFKFKGVCVKGGESFDFFIPSEGTFANFFEQGENTAISGSCLHPCSLTI